MVYIFPAWLFSFVITPDIVIERLFHYSMLPYLCTKALGSCGFARFVEVCHSFQDVCRSVLFLQSGVLFVVFTQNGKKIADPDL